MARLTKQNGKNVETKGPFAADIAEFVGCKRQAGLSYVSAGYELRAFDAFCAVAGRDRYSPQELADLWADRGRSSTPKYGDSNSVRQLGQYLTARGGANAFSLQTPSGNSPKIPRICDGPFAEEIFEFINCKKTSGRKYVNAGVGLSAFDSFCAMKANQALSHQQMAEAWRDRRTAAKKIPYIDLVREFGLFLTLQNSPKAFALPYSDGSAPKPAFTGYTSSLAESIVSFLAEMRMAGFKYRHGELCLREFDTFCNSPSVSTLGTQGMATAFLHGQAGRSADKQRKCASAVKALGKFLSARGSGNAFCILEPDQPTGPFKNEISAFVGFKKSAGYKYKSAERALHAFDKFCAMSGVSIPFQQLAEIWSQRIGGEHPNNRSSRVGPVRVFGKHLQGIGSPKAFVIADDVARGCAPEPPYLFYEDDVDAFFRACAELEPDKKDPAMHIVLPAAFLFMLCTGVRTCELGVAMDNINLQSGEVVIADAKTGGRIIYISGQLSAILQRYDSAVGRILPHRSHMFPANEKRPRRDFARRFKEIWRRSLLDGEHGSPRLYDFRHHFLYRNVELCMRSGIDVDAMRPYLMRHMGHRTPESFQYYFHLSPPIRKEISQAKTALDWMIPDVPAEGIYE